MSSESPVASVKPLAFIKPCLPLVSLTPPAGDGWLHEVKHPGPRLMACLHSSVVRLFDQRGEDWTERFRNIVETLPSLPVKSCMIDGVLVGGDVNASSRLRPKARSGEIVFYAFDLLEVNGFDLRRDEIENRKRALSVLLRKVSDTIRLNPHFGNEGEAVMRQACRMGFDGIVSKRRGSRYLSGRSTNWLASTVFLFSRLARVLDSSSADGIKASRPAAWPP